MTEYMLTDFSSEVEMLEKINEQKKEIRDLKLTYAKCRDCKHASLFIPAFAEPWIDPICELGNKKIHSDSNACEDFILWGRRGR